MMQQKGLPTKRAGALRGLVSRCTQARNSTTVGHIRNAISQTKTATKRTGWEIMCTAGASAVPDVEPIQETEELKTVDEEAGFQLACPICQCEEFKIREVPKSFGSLSCPRCARSFKYNSSFVDLTLTSGVEQRVYKESTWLGTQTFQNPLVSLVYERGWRQSFSSAGFPGKDKEFEYAMEFLRPVYGETVMDLSCGSGLFTRKFASCGEFPRVIAVDFSESMLQQTKQYIAREAGLGEKTEILAVRADVARMPFATGSLAGIHAGAAIHCWPNPTAAMAEISRVLKPGGVFVASTFLKFTAPLGEIFGDETVRPLNTILNQGRQFQYRFWEEDELKDLCNAVGLVDFQKKRNDRFIMFSARKPTNESAE